MANKRHLAILRKGVAVWNKWRKENLGNKVNLKGADLTKINLRGANLDDTDLREAILNDANLSETQLKFSNLREAKLNRANLADATLMSTNLNAARLNDANLGGAYLRDTNFVIAELDGANLKEALLDFSDFRAAELRGSDLSESHLTGTIFDKTVFEDTNFSSAIIGKAHFIDVDLIATIGLDSTRHTAPSEVSLSTLTRSRGIIPEVFLKGCGLSDWEIEEAKLYNHDLSNDGVNKILYRMYELRATQALQVSPLFISYSHADDKFVDKLERKLNEKGVRYWRDIHEMKAGRMESQIDSAINQNRSVLLVLSKHSLNSDWVEHEVRTARILEKDTGRDVLCPIALDDSWKSSKWPKHLMEQIMEYNILDFSAWEDDVKFEGMFRKLIDGLELFYKG